MIDSHDVQELIAEASRTAFIDGGYNSSLAFRPQFVSNDYHQGRKVLSTLELELSRCSAFTFSVAFVTESGITPLLQVFKELEQRGVPGRILTTDYLAFSDPRALRKLAGLSNIEIRMYQSGSQGFGFHTKGYLFDYADGSTKVLVGSSNITDSALTTNKEWNLEFSSTPKGEMLQNIRAEFETLWNVASPLTDVIQTYEQIFREKQKMLSAQPLISYDQVTLEPNAMQVAFVNNLDKMIATGANKALLISATGTGKTYASAFALRHENVGRVLFLAHREQILKQSKTSYERVLGSKHTYGLLTGNSRDFDSDYVFATMQTMSKDYVLQKFDRDAFSYIVIDEVHRAGADSYQKILDYFDADFYLGMTASPDRPDGFDVYGLFDNNIAYEIRLQQALEENLLCPFHYFGITDLTVDGHMIDDETALSDFAYLTSDERVSRIIEQAEYYGYSGDRVKGLVFCGKKRDRNDDGTEDRELRVLSEKFNARGFSTLALTGASSQDERELAIERLTADPGDPLYGQKLDYIFTIDIFNEGVDIPEVNQVIMLRPTQSPIVFVQQLGRGLRKADGKEFVVILDFIGNYNNNFMIPLALSGDRSYNKDTIRKYVMEGSRVIPGASSVHFDEIARSLIFKSIDNSTVTLRLLRDKYLLLKNKLGRIPSMVDFLEYGEVDPLLIAEKKGSYPAFLIDYEPDYQIRFTNEELLAFQYVTSFLANGMRPHELLILKELIANGETSKECLRNDLLSYCSVELVDKDYESAIRVLDKAFLNSPGDKRRYSELALIDMDGRLIANSADLSKMLQNNDFRNALLDIVEFGLKRNRSKYTDTDDGLVRYEKYTRKDVCRLLDWDQDESSTVYGYRVKHGACPIFVTYKKRDDIPSSIQYADAFIDQRTFSWMTRPRQTLESDRVLEIINAKESGLRIYLFIKKDDGEGEDFYYMGKATPIRWTQETMIDDNAKEQSVVNFRFELEESVSDDIYDYFSNAAAV